MISASVEVFLSSRSSSGTTATVGISGLTSAIMDTRTPQIVEGVKAADLLLGHDEWGMSWISEHRRKQAAAT